MAFNNDFKRRVIPNIEIENATLIYRNFSGIERPPYNAEGDRNFCVIIDDPDMAQQMAADGWNMKISRPRDDQDKPYHYLPVKVDFGYYKKPIIKLMSNNSRVDLTEETVGLLDGADIVRADLVIRPYEWDPGRIKAYVDELWVTIQQSRFAARYAEEENPGELPWE